MIGRVIVAGGGTGGHLFPGLAVVEELRRRNPALEVLFVGTARGIEARILPTRGERLETLDVKPLKGRSPKQVFDSLGVLPSALAQAMGLVRREKPDLVLGVGGYAAGPMLLAASMLGVPTAVLEQNAHVGLTNRIVGRFVGRAYVTFAETAHTFRSGRARTTGNPVRRAFVDASMRALSDPEGFEARARRIVVLGGSQGAKALNEVLPEALALARVNELGFEVLHQTGTAMRDEVAAHYERLGVRAEVVPFVDDMASVYASAALVVGRAGATTIAELCAIGRPSVLVPFPHAADDHQGKNAEALAREGAAVCLREETLSVATLAHELGRILQDREARRSMSDAARRLGKPDAAAAIVDDLCAWLGCPPSLDGSDDSRISSADSEDARDVSAGSEGTRESRAARTPKYRVPRVRTASSPHVVPLTGAFQFVRNSPE